MTLIDIVKTTSDEELLQLLVTCNSVKSVVSYFTGGKMNEQLRSYIAARAVDLNWQRVPNLATRYTVTQMQQAFDDAGCWSDIYRALGLTVCDHNKRGIVRFANHHNIDVPLFSKQDLIKAYQRNKNTWTEENIFCVDSKVPRSNLRKAVLRFGGIGEYMCSKCGIQAEWDGQELTLELDHINGIHNDNQKDNLRWLCPNCHSQTHTYKGKNRR